MNSVESTLATLERHLDALRWLVREWVELLVEADSEPTGADWAGALAVAFIAVVAAAVWGVVALLLEVAS